MKKREDKINYSKLFSVFTESKESFEGQLPDEKVLKVIRRHWFTLVLPFVYVLFLALLPFLFYIVLFGILEGRWISFYWFLVSFYYLFLWYAAFFKILIYLMDMWIITNHRIIDTELYWLFSRSTAELNLRKIQDISYEVNGLFPTLLNFGSLEIQTAGVERKFQINSVPFPSEIKGIIMKAHNNYKTLHPQIPEHEEV